MAINAIIYAMGECLIDFTGGESGGAFEMRAGGAAFNVAAEVAALGGRAELIAATGGDFFGGFIKKEAAARGIGTRHVETVDAPTALFFGLCGADGIMCLGRRGDSDLRLTARDAGGGLTLGGAAAEFNKGDILYICSGGFLTRQSAAAHKAVIKEMKAAGGRVCFDLNLRRGLWDGRDVLKHISFALKNADIIKLKDTEFDINQILKFNKNAEFYFTQNMNVLYCFDGQSTEVTGPEKNGAKPLGAGDKFIARELFKKCQN